MPAFGKGQAIISKLIGDFVMESVSTEMVAPIIGSPVLTSLTYPATVGLAEADFPFLVPISYNLFSGEIFRFVFGAMASSAKNAAWAPLSVVGFPRIKEIFRQGCLYAVSFADKYRIPVPNA